MATFIKPFTESKERSEKYAQNFDKEKITLTQCGKTFNLYDYIQAGREDTEIYPTLEKYGNLEVMARPAEDIVADFSNNLELRDLMEQDNNLRKLFDGLPLKEKRIFNNNFYEFKANGLEHYTNIMNEKIKTMETIKQQQQNTKPEAKNEEK